MAALQPAGWQEEDAGDTLIFWLERGIEDAPAVAAALAELGRLGSLEVAPESPGWDEKWKQFHTPHVVGRLYLRPPWHSAREDLLDVVVDAGAAFGTGGHATTRQCLAALQGIAPGSLLDLGCGSGVVSLAALRLGFSPVYGLDNDAVAVEAAEGNAARNRLTPVLLVGDATDPALPLPCGRHGRREHRPETHPAPGTALRSARERGGAGVASDAPPARRLAARTRRRGGGGVPRVRGGRPTRGRYVAPAASGQTAMTSVASVFVGCKISQADGEQALAELTAAGMHAAGRHDEADVVVVHTCCVTAEAERKSRRLARRYSRLGRRVIVAGCAARFRPEQFAGDGIEVPSATDWAAVAAIGVMHESGPAPPGEARNRGFQRRRGRRSNASRPQGAGRVRGAVQLLRRAPGPR